MQFYGGNMIVNLDDAAHNNVRALVNRLFTPSRLKANEAYIKQLSHKMIAATVPREFGVNLRVAFGSR